MSESLPYLPTVEAIDSEIAGGFRYLLFRPEIERRYEADIGDRHAQNLFVANIVGLVLYDLFLINDWTQVRDIFWIAVIFRIGIFTPVSILGISMMRLGSWPLKLQEKIASSVAVLSVVLVMALYSLSHSVYRQVYQYGPMMIMVFAVVVQRLRVRYCFPTVVAMMVTQTLATFYSTALDATTFQAVVTICLTVSILVLFAAYGFEHERRLSYLLSVRGQLMNEQLDRFTKIDPLTGLWNRRHLNAMMANAWTEAERTPRTMAVLLLDIDHFKRFNDTYGHLEGDNCLQQIGSCMRKALDHYGDVVVRFGGEEFLVFIPGLDAVSARNAAHLVRRAIHVEAIPYPALGDGAIVTASIGVATGRAPQVSAAVLVRGADVALYEAKHAGRDRVETMEIDAGVHDLSVAPVVMRVVA